MALPASVSFSVWVLGVSAFGLRNDGPRGDDGTDAFGFDSGFFGSGVKDSLTVG